MEYKLLRIIMNPAMILTWIFGLGLFTTWDLHGGCFKASLGGYLSAFICI